jgi:hypothetical protein
VRESEELLLMFEADFLCRGIPDEVGELVALVVVAVVVFLVVVAILGGIVEVLSLEI